MMNPPEFFSGSFGGDGDGGENRPSPRKELQGPRPPSLKVNKDSYKIRKPPVAPPHPHHPPPSQPHPQPQPQPQPVDDQRQPVIIYAVSPKVIHTTVSDFMNLVQRLTGNTTTEGEGVASSSAAGVGDLSPAARLASIEKTSPPKDREINANGGVTAHSHNDEINVLDIDDYVGNTEVEVLGRLPGILSPAPASLPLISPGFFSPWGDPYNMFIPSPSTLFSGGGPMVSPSPSSSDLFNPYTFFDF